MPVYTHLRSYTDCPEGIQKLWMGHAGETMTDLYDRSSSMLRFEWVRGMWRWLRIAVNSTDGTENSAQRDSGESCLTH